MCCPYRGFSADDHSSTPANRNVTIDYSLEKREEWTPFFPVERQISTLLVDNTESVPVSVSVFLTGKSLATERKTRGLRTKLSEQWHTFIDDPRYRIQSNEAHYNYLNAEPGSDHRAFHQSVQYTMVLRSLRIPPISTVYHGAQIIVHSTSQ